MNCEQCENFKLKGTRKPKPKHYAGEPFAANPDYEYTGDERIPETGEPYENALGGDLIICELGPIATINGGKRWILRPATDKPAAWAWTPKVGEWAYCEACKQPVLVDEGSRDHAPTATYLRPLLSSDWERDIVGFKVTAMEVDHERIRMCINGEFFTATIPSVAGGLEVTRELCRRAGIPIKPKGVE